MTDRKPVERVAEIIRRGARHVAHVTHGELLDVVEAALSNSFAHLFDRKYEWSKETFGPDRLPAGCIAHIRKELREIEQDPTDLVEWVDVAMIAMDGAARFAGADGQAFVAALKAKHEENLGREWPDWRTVPGDVPVEHVREPKVYGIDALIRGEHPPMTDMEREFVESTKKVVEQVRQTADALAIETARPDELDARLARAVEFAKGPPATERVLRAKTPDPVDDLDRGEPSVAACQETIVAYRARLDEVTADRDRWAARNRILEERLARITNIASGRE